MVWNTDALLDTSSLYLWLTSPCHIRGDLCHLAPDCAVQRSGSFHRGSFWDVPEILSNMLTLISWHCAFPSTHLTKGVECKWEIVCTFTRSSIAWKAPLEQCRCLLERSPGLRLEFLPLKATGEFEYGQLLYIKCAFLICKVLEDVLTWMALWKGESMTTKKEFSRFLVCARADLTGMDLFSWNSSCLRKLEGLHSCHNRIGSLSLTGS